MSTAEHPDALTRRIEQLAASAVDEPEAESVALPALIAALRAEIGAVRAELGALRSETGAVRSDLDGLGGRLTGSVAASRSETGTLVRRVAELATRLDGVGSRVDDLRNGLPSLTRELREGLEHVPTRTGSRLEELSSSLVELVGSRVDGVAAEIHRTLVGAQERDQRATEASSVALEEARGALEARAALVEDTLGSMAERIEALARDGASTTTARLSELLERVEALDTRVAADGRDSAELLVGRLRDVTETRLSELEDTLFDRLSDVLRKRNDEVRRDVLESLEQARTQASGDREAVRALAETVRTALEGFGSVLDSALSGLSGNVVTALREDRELNRAGFEGVSADLVDVVRGLRIELAGRADTAREQLAEVQAGVDSRLESLRSSVSSTLLALRSDVATEVGTLTPKVDELVVTGAAGSESVRTLRAELVEAVEQLRDRLVASSTDTTEVLRAAVTETRTDMAAGTRGLREDLLDRIEEKYGSVAERVRELAAATAASTAGTRITADRLVAVAALVDEVVAGLGDLRGQLGSTADRLVEQVESAGVEQLREAGVRLDQLAAELVRRLGDLDGSFAERAERITGSVDGRVAALDSAVSDRVAALDAALSERVEELDAAVSSRVGELSGAVTARVEELRTLVTDVGAHVEAGVFATTRAGEQVAELAELSEQHRERLQAVVEAVRDEVTASGQDLNSALLSRTGEALDALASQLHSMDSVDDERAAAIVEQLTQLDDTVGRGTAASETATEAVAVGTAATRELETVVAGFRAEWPTRTFEVVQGARAVAEAVVRDVRSEMGAQLEAVRGELGRATGELADAGGGLRSGTDRLAQAGAVLVAYLEQRDLLLEAERDRALHEVLDSFALGLSAKDRTALAGRVSEAVGRRRDARDAERYRSSTPSPASPVDALPAQIRELALDAPPPAREVAPLSPAPADEPPADDELPAADEPAEPPAAPPSDSGGPASPAAAPRPSKRVAAKRPGSPGRGTDPASAPAKRAPRASSGATGRAAAASGTRRSTAATKVVKAPGRAPASSADASAAPPSSRSAPTRGLRTADRGRLEVMPEVPSVDRALEAAAPEAPVHRRAGTPPSTADDGAASRAVPEPVQDPVDAHEAASSSPGGARTTPDDSAALETSWSPGGDENSAPGRLFRRRRG